MKTIDSPTANVKTDEGLHSVYLAELELVLESSEFRQSEQSKRLLRYLVEHSLDGHELLLKERAIGIALFNLEKGYDTNEHSIVRVRMSEVRKRLAKYYYSNPEVAVRFEIPSGSYRVEFKPPPAKAVSAVASGVATPFIARRFPVWKYLLAGMLLLTVSTAVWFSRPPDVVSLFWRPALRSSAPVTLCTGTAVVYRFTRSFRDKVQGQTVDHSQFLTEAPKLDPKETIPASDLVPMIGRYVGFGDSDAVAQLHAWFARQHKDSEIRYGKDFSFIDFRNSPAVMFGAHSNVWTLQFTRGCRFIFESSGDVPVIRDAQSGKIWSPAHLAENGQTDEDYLVISRLLHAESGEFLVTAAGITDYGTRTAGEILTNPSLLAEALAGVKPGWEKRNLQLLFHVKVYNDAPGPPKLMALYQW